MSLLKPWHWIFPPKPHPEDLNRPIALLARALFFTGLLALLSSLPALKNWAGSSRYLPTPGVMHHEWAPPAKITLAWFTYEVAGIPYSSHDIAFGGRLAGQIPPRGPVTVYYDPAHPAEAVLYRRPTETTLALFLFGLCSPWLARFLWRTYA